MKIEHFALQVPDPVAMADWYVKHMGLSVARAGGPPVNGRFLLDTSGSILLEIYRNPKAAIPEFSAIDPLIIHLAFLSDDPAADQARLVSAGAVVADPLFVNDQGDQVIMMRDPWKIPFQLIKRAQPMLR